MFILIGLFYPLKDLLLTDFWVNTKKEDNCGIPKINIGPKCSSSCV